LTHVYIRNENLGSDKQNALTIARFPCKIFSIHKDEKPKNALLIYYT